MTSGLFQHHHFLFDQSYIDIKVDLVRVSEAKRLGQSTDYFVVMRAIRILPGMQGQGDCHHTGTKPSAHPDKMRVMRHVDNSDHASS